MTMILMSVLYSRLFGWNDFDIYRSMSANARISVKNRFINCRFLGVHVMSNLTSNTGLNNHHKCKISIMVEQGTNCSMDH